MFDIKAYEKSRANLPHRVEARRRYAATPEGKEASLRARAAWVRRNAIKRAAHVLVGNAVRDGRLIKGLCEECGDVHAEAHHDDYTKPLSVRWLCDNHHKAWHKFNRSITK